MATMTRDEKVSRLTAMIVKDYTLACRGCSRYLTDAMRRALVSDAAVSVMLTRYEAEEEKDGNHTDPNTYVDAVRAAWKELEL